METFLKNSMFLIVDDAEPILPIFRSSEYSSPGIVELTDVGCDTESAFSGYFSRSAFERRRGGAESFRSARRTAKWRNERPTSFTIASNNFKRRNEKYVESAKAQRRENLNYDDVYMADLDYDSYTEDNAYNDFDLPRNNTAVRYKNDCYAQFGDLQNVIERSRREYFPRNVHQNYSRDFESSPNRAYQRENTFPRWFVDSEETSREKNRTKRANETLNRNSNSADFATPLKSEIWDFVSWENDTSGEELLSSDSTILKNELREVPLKRKLRNFYMQRNREENINSEREEESKEPQLENSRENLSPKPARYRASRSDSVTRRSKILQSNTPIANSPRVQSAQTSTDERSSNVCAAENASTNTRPRSAAERKKLNVNSPTDERTGETANVTSARTREDQRSIRKDNKLIKKVTNKSPSETNRPVRTNKRVVNLKIDKRTYAAKERSNTHRGNYNKVDRTNISPASRSSLEGKATTNDRVFSLKRTDTLPLVDREKKRIFISKLPVRTWKRLRTREPATSRPENDITNEGAIREQADIEIPRIHNNLSNKIDDEFFKEEEHAVRRTVDRSNTKRNNHFTLGLFDTTAPTSSDEKKIKISNARTMQRSKQKYISTR